MQCSLTICRIDADKDPQLMQKPRCIYDEIEELLDSTSFDTRFYFVQSTALLANHDLKGGRSTICLSLFPSGVLEKSLVHFMDENIRDQNSLPFSK